LPSPLKGEGIKEEGSPIEGEGTKEESFPLNPKNEVRDSETSSE